MLPTFVARSQARCVLPVDCDTVDRAVSPSSISDNVTLTRRSLTKLRTMSATSPQPLVFQPRRGNGVLFARLSRRVAGEVLFDAASRGRYATDASIYQIDPIGVLVPKTVEDVRAAVDICRELHVPMLP